MTFKEAICECERWLDYLDEQKARSVKMQKLAALARSGNAEEAQRQLRSMDRGLTVYDGARLSEAVEVLLDAIKR